MISKARINPTILKTLQKIYIIRTGVLNNKKQLVEQNLDSVFESINLYQDGKGLSVLKKFDELFNLHNDLPLEKYELINTSFTDSIYISCILEVIIIKTRHKN